MNIPSWRPVRHTMVAVVLGAAAILSACHSDGRAIRDPNVNPFTFQLRVDANDYQIRGLIALSSEPGPRPAVLVLNAANASAEQCIRRNRELTAMGLQVACVNIPGYGGSSGPSRYVGPQAVATARRALELLQARPDVDHDRIALWGLSEGAVAAGLLMDSDPNVRVLVLESGAYDMLHLWPNAPLMTKLSILRQVWPSRRILKERSVVAHLPPKLDDVNVLILHGSRDKRTPVAQAETLAAQLRMRGAHVKTCYFPKGSDDLGKRVQPELRAFLRENLLDQAPAAAS